MQTLTVKLTDDAYRTALSFRPEERDRLISVAITTAYPSVSLIAESNAAHVADDEPDYDRETNEADLEAIGRGIQDATAGRVAPADIVFARLRERFSH